MVYRLVLADDEPWALTGLEQIVPWEALGFEIVGRCGNAVEVLAIFERNGADALITDIRMPGMNGIALIGAVKRKKADAECGIVSAYSDFEAARGALEHGASGYIVKPLETEEVRKIAGRLKARLDSHPRESLRLDPRDPSSFVELGSALERNIRQPFCMALLFPVSAGQGNFPLEIQIKGASVRAAILSAGEQNPNPAEAGTFPPASAYSRRHEGPGDLEQMLREAEAAGCGNFSFAPHPLVSDIQYHIALRYREHFSLEDLASRFSIAENYLGELFKKHSGDTVINFTRKIRLQNACRLLEYSGLPPKEAAGECGFSDISYFGRVFKTYFGITPALFQDRYSGGNHFRPSFKVF